MAVRIYLSPHLDDAVLSCGGLIARQAALGDAVTVLTVCAGEPGPGPLSEFAQSLHERWGVAAATIADRRSEDRMACGRLGALVVQRDLPDAIYRRGPDGAVLYSTEEAIFGPLDPAEEPLIADLAGWLEGGCPVEAEVYCPLGFGGHVDHRLTRAAAERIGRLLWYYRDLPYAARGGDLPPGLSLPAHPVVHPLAAEEVQTWAAAAAEYRSQLSTFWSSEYALLEELREFHDRSGGIVLYSARGSS